MVTHCSIKVKAGRTLLESNADKSVSAWNHAHEYSDGERGAPSYEGGQGQGVQPERKLSYSSLLTAAIFHSENVIAATIRATLNRLLRVRDRARSEQIA